MEKQCDCVVIMDLEYFLVIVREGASERKRHLCIYKALGSRSRLNTV